MLFLSMIVKYFTEYPELQRYYTVANTPDIISLYGFIIRNVEKRINNLIKNSKKISKPIGKYKKRENAFLRSLFLYLLIIFLSGFLPK